MRGPGTASPSARPTTIDATLTALLDQVKADDDARQQFVDILELMGPDDPRTAGYRKQLTAACSDPPAGTPPVRIRGVPVRRV